jgi:hypothetical protein
VETPPGRYGDGDALAFPVAHAVLPPLQALLLAADHARTQLLPNASFMEAISGL